MRFPLTREQALAAATAAAAYRIQARLTSYRRRRTKLVDLANSVRPSTWS